MRKFYSILFAALLAVSVIGYSSTAHAWGTTSGDGSRFSQLQETAVYFNNSGETLVRGDVVILDTDGVGVASGTTLGSYITVTQTGRDSGIPAADNVLVVGVVKSASVADQRPITVVTKGPIDTLCDDSGDAVTKNAAVGTSADDPKRCGGGTNLGIALEPGDGTDTGNVFIWVAPTGAD